MSCQGHRETDTDELPAGKRKDVGQLQEITEELFKILDLFESKRKKSLSHSNTIMQLLKNLR